MSEHEIIENLKTNKTEEDFKKLIQIHESYLRRFISSRVRGTSLEEDDIYSKTLIKVWSKINSFKSEGSFKNWLFRITKNVIADEFKTLKKFNPNPVILDEALDVEAEYPTPDQEFLKKEFQEKIASKINTIKKSLSEKHRKVFELIFEQGKSYGETSVILKCSLGTVMSRVHYTRKKMQEAFNKYEYTNFN